MLDAGPFQMPGNATTVRRAGYSLALRSRTIRVDSHRDHHIASEQAVSEKQGILRDLHSWIGCAEHYDRMIPHTRRIAQDRNEMPLNWKARRTLPILVLAILETR